jgi:hypothetical protein
MKACTTPTFWRVPLDMSLMRVPVSSASRADNESARAMQSARRIRSRNEKYCRAVMVP